MTPWQILTFQAELMCSQSEGYLVAEEQLAFVTPDALCDQAQRKIVV
jgi:hypothetical protein